MKQDLLSILDYDKIPPQDIAMEEAVIGGILIESLAFDLVVDILTPDSFYKETHKFIYQTIFNLNKKNKEIDILTVKDELQNNGLLEKIGGAYYLTTLTQRTSSIASIQEWALRIKEKYIRRLLIQKSTETRDSAYDESKDLEHTLDMLNITIDTVNKETTIGTGLTHISSIAVKASEDLNHKIEKANRGEVLGVPTGLTKLDSMTLGWLPGLLIIIAARPSLGKTAFMIKFAKIAAKNGYKVLIFSIEMNEISLVHRLILSETTVDHEKYRSGKGITEDEMMQIKGSSKIIADLPIYIDDNPYATVSYMRSHARIRKKAGECDMIMVDYLQIVTPQKEKGRSRDEEVGTITSGLKAIAKELKVPVIALAQLGRKVEDMKDNRPKLSTLRESGNIEADADMVLGIHRPNYYGDLFIDEYVGGRSISVSAINRGHLIVLKHRDGPVGYIPFYYSDNLAVIEDADYKERVAVDYDPDTYIKPVGDDEDLPF